MDWQDVLEQLVRERGPALLRYGYLLTGDAADAQELVQDALVSVLARKATLRVPAAVEGYVRQTMLSSYIDGYRRRRRWLSVRHLLVSPEVADDPRHGVDARRDVVAALAGLPPRVRACVVLRYFEDLPVAEIADRLQLSRRGREAVPQRRGARARARARPSRPRRTLRVPPDHHQEHPMSLDLSAALREAADHAPLGTLEPSVLGRRIRRRRATRTAARTAGGVGLAGVLAVTATQTPGLLDRYSRSAPGTSAVTRLPADQVAHDPADRRPGRGTRHVRLGGRSPCRRIAARARRGAGYLPEGDLLRRARDRRGAGPGERDVQVGDWRGGGQGRGRRRNQPRLHELRRDPGRTDLDGRRRRPLGRGVRRTRRDQGAA
ncbi:sigma-70 family RNA polymerase sigma factor [Cellulomonas sp.]|uniref:sigma-70 family RNA polymerase sigma factor n=1 Tax=Cellulomonas sp. TaxID=40001 RepID=UPI003BAD2C7C